MQMQALLGKARATSAVEWGGGVPAGAQSCLAFRFLRHIPGQNCFVLFLGPW